MIDACSLLPTQVARISRRPTGAKLALKPVTVWGIRIRLQVANRPRDLALFELALDSKLRGCDLVRLRASDLMTASGARSRVLIVQRKTGRPVHFEVTEPTRRSVAAWIERKGIGTEAWLFPSRSKEGSPPEHAAVRAAGRPVGWPGGAGRHRIWNAQPAPDEGIAALQEDRQSEGLSAAP